jgi:hypothetical protein
LNNKLLSYAQRLLKSIPIKSQKLELLLKPDARYLTPDASSRRSLR